jgi:cation diffusion facilitator family transporter
MTKEDNNLKFFMQPLFVNLLLLVISLTLIIFKLLFAILTNSLALQADAFDTITDIVMYITAFIGILFTKKKPNKKFPYGYYKIENIISIIISIFIFITAFNIILQAFSDIINFINGNPKVVHFQSHVFLFLIISFMISIILALYLKLISKKTGSPIIESEANEKLYDIFISLSVLIGFIGVLFNWYILDSIIGLIIAGFIIKGGYKIFIESTKTLLDAVIDFEERTELYNLIEQITEIKKIDNMEIRSYGRYIFLEVEISLSSNFPLFQVSTLKNEVMRKVKEKFPSIFKIIIIVKSQDKKIIKIAVPLENNQGLNSIISTHFGESLFFGFLVFQEGNLSSSEIISNKFAHEEKRKGILISEWLMAKKIDILILKESLKKGPSLIFNNNFVEVSLTDLENFGEIIHFETEKLSK